MKSIQRSLGLALIATLLLVALVLVQTSLWLFESGLRRSLETDLREETEGLLVALVKGPNGDQLDLQRLNPRYQRPFSGHYFQIELPGRTWRSRSLWDATPQWPERPGLTEDLLDGLLDITRLDANQLQPEIRVFDVGELLGELAAHVRNVFGRAHELEPVQVRDLTLVGDNLPGKAKIGAEVGVSGGDDTADQAPVPLVVEEADHLPGNRPRVAATYTRAAAVRGADEDVRLVDGEFGVCPAQWDAPGREAELLHKPLRVFRRGREVDHQHGRCLSSC